MKFVVVVRDESGRLRADLLITADSMNAAMLRAVERSSILALRRGVTLHAWPLPDVEPVELKMQYANPLATTPSLLGDPVVVDEFVAVPHWARLR